MPEAPGLLPKMDANNPCNPGVTWKLLHSTQGPRTIKSHLHYEILPKGIESAKPKVNLYISLPKDRNKILQKYFFVTYKLIYIFLYQIGIYSYL